MTTHYLDIPLSDADVVKLKLGDTVYFSGPAFTCRSRLQRYIFDENHVLPFDTGHQNVLIHVGPIIIKENEQWKLIAFAPTSSIRFEKWGPRSVKDWKLKAIIGKTTMGKATAQTMKELKCVHVTPQYIGPNLLHDSVYIKNVYLFEELGSIEAAWQLELSKLGPFIVDIDCEGNNYFDALDKVIAKNKQEAYADLKIPKDFEYTKLY